MNDEDIFELSDSIELFLPNKICQKLKQYSISTLADLLTKDALVIAQKNRYGKKAIRIIESYQKKYQVENVIIGSPKTYEDILSEDIKYFKALMSKRLYNKLKTIGISDFGNLISLSLVDFSNNEGIGSQYISDFSNLKHLLNSNPSEVYKIYISSLEPSLPTDNGKEEKIVDLFIRSIKELSAYSPLDRTWEVLKKRYGFDNSEQYTLDDIGIFFGVSRERVRQIQEKFLVNYCRLISGDALNRPRVRLRENLITKINEVKNTFGDMDLVEIKNFQEFISHESSNDYAISRLICDLLSYQYFIYNGNEFIIPKHDIRFPKVIEICKAMENILKEKVLSIEYFDLIIEIKKVLHDRSLQKEYIDTSINILLITKHIEILENSKYQIQFDLLSSLADKSFRILIDNGKPMHFRDIHSAILQKSNSSNSKVNAIKNQLVVDKRFVPIGKTGKWALSVWNVNTDSIYELIHSALRAQNKPLSIAEILILIYPIRPDMTKEKISSFISLNRTKFYYVDKKQIILKEWGARFPEKRAIVTKRKNRIKEEDRKERKIENLVSGYLKENSKRELSLSEVIKAISSKNEIAKSSIYGAIRNSKLFECVDGSNKKKVIKLKDFIFQPIDKTSDIFAKIKKGEGKETEFKSTLRWDINKACLNTDLEFLVIRAIASFLNTIGGSLFIGVDDNGNILGLEKDYQTLKKSNSDGFLLTLTNLVNTYFERNTHDLINCIIVNIMNKEICFIETKRSDSPILVKKKDAEYFFIRTSSGSQKLTSEEMINYIRSHWK